MLNMAVRSARLFAAGRLFQDTGTAMRQLAIGVGAGLAAMLVAGQFLPLWLAATIGGGVAGFLQPILYKDLKYA
jgi:hypothetical protein